MYDRYVHNESTDKIKLDKHLSKPIMRNKNYIPSRLKEKIILSKSKSQEISNLFLEEGLLQEENEEEKITPSINSKFTKKIFIKKLIINSPNQFDTLSHKILNEINRVRKNYQEIFDKIMAINSNFEDFRKIKNYFEDLKNQNKVLKEVDLRDFPSNIKINLDGDFNLKNFYRYVINENQDFSNNLISFFNFDGINKLKDVLDNDFKTLGIKFIKNNDDNIEINIVFLK